MKWLASISNIGEFLLFKKGLKANETVGSLSVSLCCVLATFVAHGLVYEAALEAKPIPLVSAKTAVITEVEKVADYEGIISEALSEFHGKIDFQIKRSEGLITIRAWERNIFDRGQWKLAGVGRKFFTNVAEAIKTSGLSKKTDLISIEGHTDATPFMASPSHRNNISLSAIRAATVANVILEKGFPESLLTTRGVGVREPLKNEFLKDGTVIEKYAKMNRRIEVKINVPL